MRTITANPHNNVVQVLNKRVLVAVQHMLLAQCLEKTLQAEFREVCLASKGKALETMEALSGCCDCRIAIEAATGIDGRRNLHRTSSNTEDRVSEQ